MPHFDHDLDEWLRQEAQAIQDEAFKQTLAATQRGLGALPMKHYDVWEAACRHHETLEREYLASKGVILCRISQWR